LTRQRESGESAERRRKLGEFIEILMIILGFAWVGLLVVELAFGLSAFLSDVFNVIWAVFIVDFTVRFVLAAEKIKYLRSNWITAISLAIPAIRVLRVVRILRLAPVVRGIRMIRLLTSFNRSMRTLGRTMQRRGFAYMLALTTIVIFAGAAGMYAFEREAPEHEGFSSYGDALWWTAMIVTTLGSQYWPMTAAGRILCLFLAIYAFTVFGYITAVLASHFVGRDVAAKPGKSEPTTLEEIRTEIASLREQLRSGTGGASQARVDD
jgi:voltage-gated potassium channel